MTDFVHDHVSGRFTASANQEAAMVDASLRVCDLFTTTEVSDPARSKALNKTGFTSVYGNKGGRDDCGIAIRDQRFHTLDKGTEALSPLRYTLESGGRADTTEGAYAVIRDLINHDRIGVVVVVHMPHGMQDDLRLDRPGSDVAKAYRDIMRGARRLANRLKRKFKAAWTMIVGDWNLNAKSLWVPLWLKTVFPTYHLNWQPPYPKGGTWRKMIFDMALLRGIETRRNPQLLRHRTGFDHVGWRELLG